MQKSREVLKEIFVTGAKPQQEDYHDWLDSFLHKSELTDALRRLEKIAIEGDQAWMVDGELDEGSDNPVENRVVAEALRLLMEAVSGKASVAHLEELKGMVDKKASVEALNAALEAIETKANKDEIYQALYGLEAALAKKAGSAELTAVAEEVEKKANAEDVVPKAYGLDHAGKYLKVDDNGVVTAEELEVSAAGNLYNVTVEQPLASGYYGSTGQAVSAVPAEERQKGLCVTWEFQEKTWKTKQFVGSDPTNDSEWNNEANWEDFGSGSLSGLSVNGTPVVPDEDGNVDLEMVKGVKLNGTLQQTGSDGTVNIQMDTIEVDETLDPDSTNPVENRVLTAALQEQKENAVTGMEIEAVEDGSGNPVYNLVLNRQWGDDLSVELPAGMGGSGGGGATSRIVLRAWTDKSQVKDGGSVTLGYHYDHVNSDNESDGTKSDITITVKKGSTITLQKTLKDVSSGDYSLDVSSAMQAGTIDIYVRASCTVTGEGGETSTQSKQAYASVKVVQIGLTTSYDLGESLGAGGYADNETAIIPWAVTGSGMKEVRMIVDGDTESWRNRSQLVGKAGTTNGEFLLSMNGLTAGRHSVQLVAEVEGIQSESIWIDLLKGGGAAPYIGLLVVNGDGTIFESEYPTVEAAQYEQMSFNWAAYDVGNSVATVEEREGETVVKRMSVGRTMQHYINRFNESGEVVRALVCGETVYPLTIEVGGSAIDVSEAVGSLALRLKAAGRSNEESEPGVWTSGNVETTFDGVDWNVSGWDGESLVLKNGASAEVCYQPFAVDPGATGLTVEMEYRMSNATSRDGMVISCLSGGKGFSITTEEISLLTGGTKSIVDDDTGESIEKPAGVMTNYAQGEWMKVAFVIGRRQGNRLMELYVNGVRSSADVYGSGDSFLQSAPVGIRFESGSADLEVRSVRVYSRALSDDEEVDNYIIDRPTGEEIYEKYESNGILTGDTVDIDLLRSKGKGVLRIIRQGGLAELNATNDKKAKFYADVIYYSPFGQEYDFYAKSVLVQIQGTSSTKYPSKNYRISLGKGTGDGPVLYVGAEAAKELAVPGSGVSEAQKGNTANFYRMREGAIPINIFVMKKDYSDSSMTHNTGSSKLMNEVFKEMGILTPAQEINPNYRTGFDGIPIDIFSSESHDGESEYYGQYNFNNEKADSGRVYGLTAIYDEDGNELLLDEALCCLEFLNNSEPLCNFQLDVTDDQVDDYLAANFDKALEFRYPETGIKWAGASADQKNAVKRLWKWIRDKKPAGAEIATRLQEQAGDDRLSTWENGAFKTELGGYIHPRSMMGWYAYTDYFMSVDQRVKNLMLATWDGLVWYFLYWDGDTMLGDRNDSYLAYDYLLTRTTWDPDRNKYGFEGHDSWLWNLMLANMTAELSETANAMREVMTNARVNRMFDEEQQGNWCERAYNKSGYIAYIHPQLVGVDKQGELTKYPFMYALKGRAEAHRHFTIENRFSLLDAKYQCSGYKSDNIDAYVARTASDTPNMIVVVSDEPYYFGWGTNNQTYQIGIEAQAGEDVTLTLGAALTANDPIRVYGASRMREINLSGMGSKMTGQWNFNKCVKVRKLTMAQDAPTGGSWFMVIDNCKLIEELDVTNQTSATTMQGGKELDLTSQTRLRELKAWGSQLTAVVLAKGAPVELLRLPSTMETLRLESLPQLTMDGLQVENYARIRTLAIGGCPGVSWETVADRCPNLERMRVEIPDWEGDGQDLVRLMSRNLQGLDAQGNYVNYCALYGRYRLTRFIPEEVKAAYPELEIVDPEYTMIEFDDTVSDPKNISNLDNGTGYKYGTDYVVSGHIVKILEQRHRVLAKVTAEGEMTYYPLHDRNSNYYADAEATDNCTEAQLNGSEGDVMMYEPHYWYKGVNDWLNGKKYTCYSAKAVMPKVPEAMVLTKEDLEGAGMVRQNYKVLTGKGTLSAAQTADSSYAVCHVQVSGYRRVRFPSVQGSSFLGSIMVNEEGTVVRDIRVETLSGGFENGMYVIAEVPEGATDLYFTILKSAEFDKVVLSNSDRIEDMEPDWVEHEVCLTGVAESSVVGGKIRSVMTSGASVASISWSDFNWYSAQRGMQQIDYEMHKDIANLFYAKYGTRDSQDQCGYGQSSNTQPMNRTAGLGMTDTINPNHETSGSWYWNEADPPQLVSCGSVNALGYQNLFGDKYETMDGVTVNKDTVDGKWTITMADGSERKVKGATGEHWIKSVVHGKFCDVIPAGNIGDSSTTYFCDYFYYSGSVGRVVYRSSYYAYAHGGVAYAIAYHDPSHSYTYVGSRLAFRGRVVKAASVAAYKAMSEVS